MLEAGALGHKLRQPVNRYSAPQKRRSSLLSKGTINSIALTGLKEIWRKHLLRCQSNRTVSLIHPSSAGCEMGLLIMGIAEVPMYLAIVDFAWEVVVSQGHQERGVEAFF